MGAAAPLAVPLAPRNKNLKHDRGLQAAVMRRTTTNHSTAAAAAARQSAQQGQEHFACSTQPQLLQLWHRHPHPGLRHWQQALLPCASAQPLGCIQSRHGPSSQAGLQLPAGDTRCGCLAMWGATTAAPRFSWWGAMRAIPRESASPN